MRFFFALLLIAAGIHPALAVDATAEEAFSKSLLLQIEKLNAEKQLEQKNRMSLLRQKYPDLFPPRENYYSLKFYNQTFDTSLANTVFFAPGSSYLSDVQIQKIETIAQAMGEVPETSLIIEGHSANNYQIENPEDRLLYNRWISGRRAVQVWNHLTVELGIDPTRIAMYAYDAQRTLNNESTETQRALNRRVEMRLTNQPIDVSGRAPRSNAPSRPRNQQTQAPQ